MKELRNKKYSNELIELLREFYSKAKEINNEVTDSYSFNSISKILNIPVRGGILRPIDILVIGDIYIFNDIEYLSLREVLDYYNLLDKVFKKVITRKSRREKLRNLRNQELLEMAIDYNVDPKLWYYVEEVAENVGVEIDDYGIDCFPVREIVQAYYNSGAKLGGKLRLYLYELFHATKKSLGDEDAIIFYPSIPDRSETAKEYKYRLRFWRRMNNVFPNNHRWELRATKYVQKLLGRVSVKAFYLLIHGIEDKFLDNKPVRYEDLNWDLYLSKKDKTLKEVAKFLPNRLLWRLKIKRLPKGFETGICPNPFKLTKSGFKVFRKLHSIITKDNETDNATALAAFRIAQIFKTWDNVERWFNAIYGDRYAHLIYVPIFIHDAGQIQDVELSQDAINFLIAYPETRWKIKFLENFEKNFGRAPRSRKELEEYAARLEYIGIDNEIVEICAKYNLDQDEAEDYDKFFRRNPGKKYESLPYVCVEYRGYTLEKMNAYDKEGPFLGLATACCQHLHNSGADCAKAGWKSPVSAFYVIRNKEGRIVGQSWAWRSSCGKYIVFDSVEGRSFVPVEIIAELIRLAAKTISSQYSLGVQELLIGDTNYGLTKALHKYFGYPEVDEIAETPDSLSWVDYWDGDEGQWRVPIN